MQDTIPTICPSEDTVYPFENPTDGLTCPKCGGQPLMRVDAYSLDETGGVSAYDAAIGCCGCTAEGCGGSRQIAAGEAVARWLRLYPVGVEED